MGIYSAAVTAATTTSTSTSTSSIIKTIVHNSSCSGSSNQNRVSIALPIVEVNDGTATAVAVESAEPATATNATDTSNVGNANNPATNATTTTNGIEVLEDPQLQQQLQQVQQQQEQQQQLQQLQQQQQPQQQQIQQHEQRGVRRSNTIGGGVSAVGVSVSVGGASTSNATTITSISALSPQTPATTPSGGTGSIVGPLTHPLAAAAAAAGSTNPSNQVTPIPKPKHHQQQQQQQQLSSISNPMHKVTKRKETLEAKRERKAAKTLAIITGAFVVCWLPFFVTALLLPLCDGCEINDSIAAFFLWLGYFNSTLNPVIYTIFSPEFRQAFKRILFGAHRPVHYRSGKL